MEATKANQWAADIARYLKAHQPKRAMALRSRIKHMTVGNELDDNDLDQLERAVRRMVFGDPHLAMRKGGINPEPSQVVTRPAPPAPMPRRRSPNA